MNYRKTIYLLCLTAFFVLFILHVNKVSLDDLDGTLDPLLRQVSATAGYTSVVIHGTVYALFFFLILNEDLSAYGIQHLTRMKRQRFWRMQFMTILKNAFVFVGIYILVQVLVISFHEEASFLLKVHFYWGSVISFMLTYMYYVLLGIIFSILSFILGTKTKALAASFILATLMMAVGFILKLCWMPANTLTAFEYFLALGRDSAKGIITDALQTLALIAFTYFLAIQIFLSKDVYHDEES